ncbi:LytTR family DNA-binding domain-containing protein [Tateyamaria armeniaca]|uniref:LytTR family DNA-binding domain-containing protein n=1 Tax=Tateyamaria armeniaca TaxID=2518930 RepID=A0ABW8V1V6_9RHOB
MFAKNLDHKVHVYVSNGSMVHFTLREMHELYRSWQMWVLIAVGFFIMSTGHPVTLPQFDSFGLRMAFWFVALFIYMLTSDLYSKVTGKMWHRLFGKAIPLIFLSAPLVLASTYIAGAVLSLLFEPWRPPLGIMTWQMNVRNILVAHAFETLALLWLIPAQRLRNQTTPSRRTITLAGRSFALAEIGRVKAAEHYLEVHMESGIETIRERMSTFLEQVTPQDGIQTHRSHWVAQGKAAKLNGAKLGLVCGDKVPVARGRLEDVRDWLRVRDETGEAA